MVIVGILLFALLILLHEFGHFLAARRNGVVVEEFGIGFPPRLLSRRFGKHKTRYSLNLIPLGGFVKLKGEADGDKSPGSFGRLSLPRKALVLLAGVGMNIATVYLLVLLLAATGLPAVLPNQFSVKSDEKLHEQQVAIAQVEPGSAAEHAGLKIGDRIKNLDGQTITSSTQLRRITRSYLGKTVMLDYKRGRQLLSAQVKLGSDKHQGALGVVPVDFTVLRYGWSAPLVAAGVSLQMLWLTLSAIVSLVVHLLSGGGGAAAQNVTGPVGVFLLLRHVGDFGLSFLLVLLASISASLAVINALPIPALDGGRLAVIAGARILKKRLSSRTESAIHTLGFVVLLGLIVLISYLDVKRFF